MMELGPELYTTDMSVLKTVTISQIVLGIPLLVWNVFEIWMIGLYVNELPFFWYVVPLEVTIAILSIFCGSFGLRLIRNAVRTKRHFDVLSLTSFVSCVLASLLLAVEAFTAMVSAVAFIHSYRVGNYLRYDTLVRTGTISDVVIQVFLVLFLILHLKLVRTAFFNANIMGVQHRELTPRNAAYENVTFGTAQKVSVIDEAENLLIG